VKVVVRAFARFREVVGDVNTLDIPEGSGIQELLTALGARSHECRDLLFDEEGRVREHIIVMVNRRRLARNAIASTVLSEEDEVAIYPPVAGG
jgi:molybdopterin synthase sulfur carrier subunit